MNTPKLDLCKFFSLALLTAVIFNLETMAEKYNPIANPDAVVISDNVRFTVLTDRVIRMEWSEDLDFEDKATLTFVNRNTPVPNYNATKDNGILKIETSCLTLKYKIGSGKFTADNLSIDYLIDSEYKTWRYGDIDDGNLLGTTRTLDKCNADYNASAKVKVPLEEGIISRNGWCMIDDSRRPLFDNSDWQWVTARPEGDRQDIYFFGYGLDYKAALKDFTLIAGKIALPPRFVFGAWWSKYWNYDDIQLRDIVEQFNRYDLGLDVLVIDMDWHITSKPEWFDKEGNKIKDQAGQRPGWTGFTWNETYFPDPEKFIQWTNQIGIKTCMNLHPASGIQPYEDKYEQMAKAMGIDPATKQYVPFDIVNKDFAKAYLEILLRPMEQMGIDFWWLDWQQWSTTTIEGVNPTFYLNYVHHSDMQRQGKRPLIFHRWGGLGNHRYQIGFSGDTLITWDSLNYQPYFTSTASNVGFGYWSHDIGGHYCRYGYGIPDSPELHTRWIQFGILSPVFRTHATADRRLERRPWMYPAEYFQAMRKCYDLRYALIPYIYTSARQAYDTGISMCRPLYYDYPKCNEAYEYKNQYMFGDSLLVHPITAPMQEGKIYSIQKTWLPAGEWIEYETGEILEGNQVVSRAFGIDEIPVYIKAGSIVPMATKMNNTAKADKTPLVLNIYPANYGQVSVYNDSGNDLGFKDGEYAFTNVEFTSGDSDTNIFINKVDGSYKGMPKQRGYIIKLINTISAKSVKINGREVPFNKSGDGDSWYYDGKELATVICVDSRSVGRDIKVSVEHLQGDRLQLSGIKGKMKRLHSFIDYVGRAPEPMYEFEPVVQTSLASTRMTYQPSTSASEALEFENDYERSLEIIESKVEDNQDWLPYLEFLKLY